MDQITDFVEHGGGTDQVLRVAVRLLTGETGHNLEPNGAGDELVDLE